MSGPLVILNSSKTLVAGPPADQPPAFLAEADQLARALAAMGPRKLEQGMKVSARLAQEVRALYAAYQPGGGGSQALASFRGDVFQKLDWESLPAAARRRAPKRLAILSGLYGILRPDEAIQAYRLEMGYSMNLGVGPLAAFWRPRITQWLSEASADSLINLASNEYWQAVDAKRLGLPVHTPVFMEVGPKGPRRVAAIHAKWARGAFARHCLQASPWTLASARDFQDQGFSYAPDLSSDRQWVYLRQSS